MSLSIARAALLTTLAVTAACTESFPRVPTPDPKPVPASRVVETGAVAIRRETFVIAGAKPPPNPVGNRATPDEQNRVRVVRYRVESSPPKPARAVFVMMPGFLGGALSLDGLARAIVRRSTETEAFEAWAIDRRSNLLEDTTGVDRAEAARDPSIARRYYFEGEAIRDKTFSGFLRGSDAPWASEWGMATTLGDLRAVIGLVPEAARAQRVVLVGHSLGASIVESYAAWDFDGKPGYADLAGLVLVDGAGRREGEPASAVDRNVYEKGGGTLPAGLGPSLGVETNLRAGGDVFFALPFLGVKAYVVAEYLAMKALWSPTEVTTDDPEQASLTAFLLGLSQPLPKIQNRAAFGLAFDEASSPLSFATVKTGRVEGGPVTPYKGILGDTLIHPSDPAATYTWAEWDRVTPRENTALDDMARSWFDGPGTNYAEWYFPQRLTLDATVTTTLNVREDDWRWTAYGLRAKHGAAIDVPVYAAAFSLLGSVEPFQAFKKLLPPIGAGRPLAGKPRTDRDAFREDAFVGLSHLDGIIGVDVEGSDVRRFYEAVIDHGRKATPPGGVVVDVR